MCNIHDGIVSFCFLDITLKKYAGFIKIRLFFPLQTFQLMLSLNFIRDKKLSIFFRE